MRNSLIFKLMGAFLLVIAIGSLVISFLTSAATRSAFNLYTTRSGQVWAQRLAPDLADYYARAHGWNGIEDVLQSDFGAQIGPAGMGMGQGRMLGQGMGAMGQRLILADAAGLVVGDTQAELVGKQLSAADLKNGAAITLENNLVGTIIVTPNDLTASNTPAAEFLASVNRAIASSALIAGVIALLLGGVLFLQIISPLRKLNQAAAAIARGDLGQRVHIPSRDELGELGATFNQMAESLAHAEAQRQRLAADVAHELRTPLSAIQATIEGMQDGVLALDQEQIAALHSETMLLNRLVGDLKLLSLAEAGQLRLERQAVEPGALIRQIVERAKPQARQKEIHLETILPAGLPEIWLDSDRITQVLNNLIANALRYTPQGGTITLEGRAAASNAALEISVSDSGQGIAPEDLPFVFDRFYRADKSRTRASGGSGLGLAIVKQLVEAHGGSVKAESPLARDSQGMGYGTKITLTLPRQK